MAKTEVVSSSLDSAIKTGQQIAKRVEMPLWFGQLLSVKLEPFGLV